MTARSFTEAFASTDGNVVDHVLAVLTDESFCDSCANGVKAIRELLDSRERAIRWAVTLESECAEKDAEIERLRAALRHRNEKPSDEKLADFVTRAERNSSSRAWRIVGYLARCVQDERAAALTGSTE